MRAPTSGLATIALAVALLALGGCGRLSSGPVHACNMKSTSWAAKANGAVPGIDEASVTAITLSIGTNGQTNVYPVVIWSDLSGEAPGQVRGTGNATICVGSHSSADGRCVQFEWQESDGQVGPVIIAGVPHDLTSGFLFLVSTRQPPCVIAQVPYNLADFPTDKDALKKLAESDPTIGDFFRKHAGTDAPR